MSNHFDIDNIKFNLMPAVPIKLENLETYRFPDFNNPEEKFIKLEESHLQQNKKRTPTSVTRLENLKQENEVKAKEIYPRTGRRKHFKPEYISMLAFPINAHPHWVHMPNTDWRHSIPFVTADLFRFGNMLGFANYLREHCIPNVEFIHQYDGERIVYSLYFLNFCALSCC